MRLRGLSLFLGFVAALALVGTACTSGDPFEGTELTSREPAPDFRLTDQFGRRLAYVYTEHGYSIDETLVREGLGTAWTEDAQHRDYLVGLERTARGMESGCLWSE